MKQKYTILKDEDTGALTIQEYAELSKDMFSLICEESYAKDTIASAMSENKKALIDTLRTPNLYPISEYIDKIADSVIDLFENRPSEPSVELIFDDVDLFKREEPPEEEEDESVEIEDLLEDESDDTDDSSDADATGEEEETK